jgi:hypothetical protein
MARPSRYLSIATLVAFAVVGLVMLSLSSCGTGARSADSGVRGVALIAGGPAPGSPRPEPGVAIVVHKGDLHGRIVARTTAASSGAFKVDLSPGTYTLIEVSGAAVSRTVTVEPGTYVAVTLQIDAP